MSDVINETPLNETDLTGLKEIEQLGVDFKSDYRLINIYLQNVINRYHRYILKPTLQEKTVECVTNLDFTTDNYTLYMDIRNNDNILPEGDVLPEGYSDTDTFLSDYDTSSSYLLSDCPDVYEVEFHQNMYSFYTAEELVKIRTKYDNITQFQAALLVEEEEDTTDMFDIKTRLNILVKALLSNL